MSSEALSLTLQWQEKSVMTSRCWGLRRVWTSRCQGRRRGLTSLCEEPHGFLTSRCQGPRNIKFCTVTGKIKSPKSGRNCGRAILIKLSPRWSNTDYFTSRMEQWDPFIAAIEQYRSIYYHDGAILNDDLPPWWNNADQFTTINGAIYQFIPHWWSNTDQVTTRMEQYWSI